MRVQFVALFEVWSDEQIKYLPIQIEGDFIPLQEDMEARGNLVEAVSQGEYEVLDLISVVQDEIVIWKD